MNECMRFRNQLELAARWSGRSVRGGPIRRLLRPAAWRKLGSGIGIGIGIGIGFGIGIGIGCQSRRGGRAGVSARPSRTRR